MEFIEIKGIRAQQAGVTWLLQLADMIETGSVTFHQITLNQGEHQTIIGIQRPILSDETMVCVMAMATEEAITQIQTAQHNAALKAIG